jgi:hypothetical protein
MGVVWYAEMLHLYTKHERDQMLFSETAIRYNGYEERRNLTCIALRHFALLQGGACYSDPTMTSCRDRDNNLINDFADSHFSPSAR